MRAYPDPAAGSSRTSNSWAAVTRLRAAPNLVGTHSEPGRTMNQPFPQQAPPSPMSVRSWFGRGRWYPFVVVLSLGILAFVPFVHAATRARRPLMVLTAALYTAAVLVLFMSTKQDYFGGLLFGLLIVGGVHSVLIRPYVWPSLRRAAGAESMTGLDPAVAAVLAARNLRAEARTLAARDPQMARELGIGRPDLPGRRYDDGGLVDLNSAPAQAIAAVCGIDLAVAAQIVQARTVGVPFLTVDDAFTMADVPFPLWDRIRDRGIVISA
jgi:hypothetical protein